MHADGEVHGRVAKLDAAIDADVDVATAGAGAIIATAPVAVAAEVLAADKIATAAVSFIYYLVKKVTNNIIQNTKDLLTLELISTI